MTRRAATGSDWERLDPLAKGRVQILPVRGDAVVQAQAAVMELQRLAALSPDWDWSRCAVIAREWRYLEPVRACCEHNGIPVQSAAEAFPSLWRLREDAGGAGVRCAPTGPTWSGTRRSRRGATASPEDSGPSCWPIRSTSTTLRTARRKRRGSTSRSGFPSGDGKRTAGSTGCCC